MILLAEDIALASETGKTEYILPAGAYRLTARQERYLTVKRCLDGLLSLVLLALLAIPMAVIAGLVKLSSPRQPVLFRQERVGRDGAPFLLWKFRSIDAATGAVTPLGRVLRKASLDELPQLVQVLSGSMSLIGPRPLIPEEVSVHRLRRAAGVYRLRPGLTGLAQISGRDMVDDERKAAYDRAYLEHLSFGQDWRIFWATVGKVIRCEDVEQK